MAEFNENPFKKDTPVRPFSNGSEADSWHHHNCLGCNKYENSSTTEEEAKCKLAFHIDLGFLAGDIPLWVAKDIGCTYDPIYGTVNLYAKCRYKTTGEELF